MTEHMAGSESESEFIVWKGGEMPVPDGTVITVKYRNGVVVTCTAGDGYSNDWSICPYRPLSGDIVAYKVVDTVVPSEQTEQMAGAISTLANAALEFLEYCDTAPEEERAQMGQHLHACATNPRILEAVRLLRLP